MSKNHYFQVSYKLSGQAKTTQVQAETPALTPEQARYHVESLHGGELPTEITDVTVKALGDARQVEPGKLKQA